MKEDTQWEKSLKEASDRALSTVYFPGKSKTKMEDTYSAVSLLDKWREKSNKYLFSGQEYPDLLGEIMSISQHLDMMCEASGMKIVNGSLCFDPTSVLMGGGELDGYYWFSAFPSGPTDAIPATEIHAMLEWLLIKTPK
jgi:hypothetical protein